MYIKNHTNYTKIYTLFAPFPRFNIEKNIIEVKTSKKFHYCCCNLTACCVKCIIIPEIIQRYTFVYLKAVIIMIPRLDLFLYCFTCRDRFVAPRIQKSTQITLINRSRHGQNI